MSAAPIPAPSARRKLAHEMNVVPYIDVMLVLLVIFMVTAPLMQPGIEVNLPEVGGETMSGEDNEPVTLYVDAEGRYFLDIGENQDQALSPDEIEGRLGAVLRNQPERMILVRADASVAYEAVARGGVLLQSAGAKRIGFVTDPDSRR
ncbi:ExbD/TolR family protein [Algiphilus aromaticivorans]|uniref:ExbD/TolR family protein n=1 Tax=Algiphilus aromaticivorans TaxID=382454 RepID=UPI0005C15B83|nr:ExbD/TolR family protein [Algiphilus aromaticivorans]